MRFKSYTILNHVVKSTTILFCPVQDGNRPFVQCIHTVCTTCSLLVYRKASCYCMLILYTASLLESFIRYKNFLLESLGSFKNRIISANGNNFTSLFPIYIPFNFILLPYSLRIKYILNKNIKSGHFCLITNIKGNTSIFPLLR
jgi:hypothetical protein